MALIIPPGYLQAVYEFTLSGDSEPMVITIGHEIDGASGATIDNAPDDLMTAFRLTVGTQMLNPYALEGVTIYGGNDGPPNVRTSSQARFIGPQAANALPPNTAYLIRKRTDLAGRRGRGRCYLPGVPELQVDSVGNITTTQLGLMQTEWNDFMAEITTKVGGRHYPPVVLHRSEGVGVEPPPTPVLSFVVESKVATQRRRLRP